MLCVGVCDIERRGWRVSHNHPVFVYTHSNRMRENQNEWCFYGTWKDVRKFLPKESCENTRTKIVQLYTYTRNFKLENENYYRFQRKWMLTLFHDGPFIRTFKHTHTHAHKKHPREIIYFFSFESYTWFDFPFTWSIEFFFPTYFLFLFSHKIRIAGNLFRIQFYLLLFIHKINCIEWKMIFAPDLD